MMRGLIVRLTSPKKNPTDRHEEYVKEVRRTSEEAKALREKAAMLSRWKLQCPECFSIAIKGSTGVRQDHVEEEYTCECGCKWVVRKE